MVKLMSSSIIHKQNTNVLNRNVRSLGTEKSANVSQVKTMICFIDIE
jgi:hypothetical protein